MQSHLLNLLNFPPHFTPIPIHNLHSPFNTLNRRRNSLLLQILFLPTQLLRNITLMRNFWTKHGLMQGQSILLTIKILYWLTNAININNSSFIRYLLQHLPNFLSLSHILRVLLKFIPHFPFPILNQSLCDLLRIAVLICIQRFFYSWIEFMNSRCKA